MKTNSEIAEIDYKDINNIIKGDIVVFEKIYRLLFQKLFEFAFHFLNDEQISEDIVQDVFIYLWENKTKLDPKVNLEAYLYTAVKNKSLNFKRHQRVKQKYSELQLLFPDSVEMPDDIFQKQELLLAIEKAINLLPEKRRIIFIMHRFEKLTYSQIAEIQKISVKTVETQIRRSLQFLRKKILQLVGDTIDL